MGFANGKEIYYYYSLFSLVLCLCLCESNDINDFDIFRSKHDIFTNLKCKNENGITCTNEQCNLYNANCVEKNNCEYCICSRENKTTFITTEDASDGVCNGDEDVLHGCYRFCDASFMAYLELGETGLKQTDINISSPSITKTRECQIRKIFEFSKNGKKWKTHTGTPFLLKKTRTNIIKLEINPAEDFVLWNGSLIKIAIDCEGNRDVTDNEERCFLFKVETLPRYDETVIPAAQFAIRKESNNKLMADCESKTGNTLVRKERDKRAAMARRRRRPLMPMPGKPTRRSSSMSPNNQSPTIATTKLSPTIATTKLSPTTPTTKLSPTTPTTKLSPTTPTTKLSPTTPTTKLSPTTPTTKLSPTTPTTKLSPTTPTTKQSPTTPTTKLSPTTQPGEPTNAVKTSQNKSPKSTKSEKISFKHPSEPPTPVTAATENLDKGQADKTSKSDKKNISTTIIAVTVTLLVLALVLALGYLVYHKRRKRAQAPQGNFNDLSVMNHSKKNYQDSNQTYETIKEDRAEVSINQPGTPLDIYSYPDTNSMPNPTSSEQDYTYAKDTDIAKPSVSPEQEYTYAKNTDVPRDNSNTKVVAQDSANSAVYHTLEQPEQPCNDNFYHYPDNTDITKTPSSELEYTYAKETDFSRETPNTKIATQDSANSAVYHTLEQPGQPGDDFYHYPDNTSVTKTPPSELEYTYAKDTDFSKGTPNTKVATQDSANSAVYHTLEQPGQPDDDFYHYPDNTSITKTLSSELEYTYAKETEITNSIVNTKTVPNENIFPAANNALHHNPDQKKQAPTEPEYSYAKNTDIPSFSPRTGKTTNGDSETSPSDNSVLYHTLEEPSPPVYSTLEEPEDVHNKVNDDGLNFSDHMQEY